MIHVVFQQSDVEVLQQAMELDELLKGEVFEIKDDLGVGPVSGLDTDGGWNARLEWWRSLLIDTPYGEKLVGSFDDRETVKQLKEIMRNFTNKM